MRTFLDANEAFPVDTVLCRADNISPASFLGGTWQKIAEGQTIIGANADYPLNSTGGEAAHTLTIAEMPSHNHKSKNVGVNAGTWTNHGVTASANNPAYDAEDYVGGDAPHNNMQPYVAKNYWQRIA